jgi:2-polyprenyl-3-methyl-5-hydroxy-6-metoxy-1,4-benzoquinol methylase
MPPRPVNHPAFLNGYVSDPATQVLRPHRRSVADSRGRGKPDERFVATAIRDAADPSSGSAELARSIHDWRSMYHLSPRRSGVLVPAIESMKKGPILEVGAGLGAITRRLGETGESVYAIEMSAFRADVCASRCRDLENVTVIHDEFAAFDPGPVFQTVVMVGVLEYARAVSTQPSRADPVQQMLEHVMSMLAPSGELILAIENQMGLKYFAGYREDHLLSPMTGVEDRYTTDGPVTFGGTELRQRLNTAGFEAQHWYYPFPDFKFAQLVIDEAAAVDEPWEELATLIADAVKEDPQRPDSPSFDVGRAWQVTARNRVIHSLAHSFLIRAARTIAPGPFGGVWDLR